DRDGTVKVADLGLAKVIHGSRTGYDETISGTPHYISPEQACGEADLDCRTDIYSLGAMLYHLTTGYLPFHGLPDREVMESQVNGFLPDPMESQPDASMEMSWLIEKMMVKSRESRTSSWKETLEDFTEVSEGFPPTPPLPAPGLSTVKRCDARASASLKKRKKTDPSKTAAATAGEPKQKIVLSKELRSLQQRKKEKERPYETSGSVMMLLFLCACVAGAWFLFSFLFSGVSNPVRKAPIIDQSLPPRSTVIGHAPAAQAPSPTKPFASPDGKNRTSPNGSSSAATWDDPAYQRGARIYNEALALYKQHLAKREDISMLPQVEDLCHQAAKIFESRQSAAPSNIRIDQRIKECYQMISDCRQSTLLAPGAVAKPVREAPAAAASGAAEAAKAGVGPAFFATNFVLSANWALPARGGELTMKDLGKILSDWVKPAVELKPDPSVYLFGHINVSMSATDAARLAGIKLKPRKPIGTPGFPQDSFFYYEIPGDYGNGFNTMLLIVDRSDQTAAVQLVNDTPDTSLWIEPQFFTDQWHVYDFVREKTKGNAAWKIAHRAVVLDNNIIRIDSEEVADNASGYFGLGDSKARVSLFLPENIASLILRVIQQNQKP
ncbi:MAG: protein kinase, partial [Lentisphaerota bacterium]